MSVGEKEPSELLDEEAIDQIIDINDSFFLRKQTSPTREIIRLAFSRVNSQSDILDERVRLAKKSANIVSGIIEYHPFRFMNAKTSFVFALGFLKRFRYELSTDDSEAMFEIIRANHQDLPRLTTEIEKLFGRCMHKTKG